MRKEKVRQRRTKKDKVDKFVMGALKKKGKKGSRTLVQFQTC
jgi:hypothetical protein